MKLRTNRAAMPALEWLCDVSGKTARITSIGGTALLIENHRGLIGYAEDCVEVASGCGTVTVKGRGLSLSDVRRDAMIVRGEIESVQLPCGGLRHES